MKCTILHDTAGRIRVHLEQPRMSLLKRTFWRRICEILPALPM